MQGRQNVPNLERKGPHKSMHCKFCKPPGVVTPEKPTRAQLETKTKIHLVHDAADLRICNVNDEPGFPATESEACMCVLEGEKECSKCVPDKSVPPPKKKKCYCPKGAKPHLSMLNDTKPTKKKKQDEDNEFWWEKYSREHDIIAQETWEAYMAQRKKDKKMAKCQKKEESRKILKLSKGIPFWYQKLSCQQMIYVEFLSKAIRLDSDENITDRTFFVLGGLGLYPKPKRKVLRKCLRHCHYNSIRFLKQLYILIKDDDPFHEKAQITAKIYFYSWNEILLMNAICHLEFPALLREIMDRMPPLPRSKLLPQIPYPAFPKEKKKYDDPYEEPIWQDRLNWIEKDKIDRLNRCRAYMDTKRVKIPPLALVRRPSLIDARPPFLAQIEANEKAGRRFVKSKKKKVFRKHTIPTFNSKVDMTAIANIEASEISVTEKTDTDEICVFLRDPLREPESVEAEDEEVFLPEKEIKFAMEVHPEEVVQTQINRIPIVANLETDSQNDVEIPFRTPPKTNSGHTIVEPYSVPKTTPQLSYSHSAKRELDIINEEVCKFFPIGHLKENTPSIIATATQEIETFEVMSAAACKLKELVPKEEPGEEEIIQKKKKSKKLKKRKKSKKRKKKKTQEEKKPSEKKKPPLKSKRPKKRRKVHVIKKEIGSDERQQKSNEAQEQLTVEEEEVEEEEEHEDEEECEEEEVDDEEELEGLLDVDMDFTRLKNREKRKIAKKRSEMSDPDPDIDDQWATRPPCKLEEVEEPEVKTEPRKKKKTKKKKKDRKKKKGLKKRKTRKDKNKKKKKHGKEKILDTQMMEPLEETGEYFKKRHTEDATAECFKGDSECLYKKYGSAIPEDKRELEQMVPEKIVPEKVVPEKVKVFTGDVDNLLLSILKDLADEGFISATYFNIHLHPDIAQLMLYLKGVIINKKLRKQLIEQTKYRWENMNGIERFSPPELGISQKRMDEATWNDKGWMTRLAHAKKDEFYFKVASSRAQFGRRIYETLAQEYFGTGRYLKIFYAYMTSKFQGEILRGVY